MEREYFEALSEYPKISLRAINASITSDKSKFDEVMQAEEEHAKEI